MVGNPHLQTKLVLFLVYEMHFNNSSFIKCRILFLWWILELILNIYVWYVVNNAGISMLYVWICYCYGDEVTIWDWVDREESTAHYKYHWNFQRKAKVIALKNVLKMPWAIAFVINASSLRIKMLILSSIITINY